MGEALLSLDPTLCKNTRQVWLYIALDACRHNFAGRFVLFFFLSVSNSLIVTVSHGNYNTVTLLEMIN